MSVDVATGRINLDLNDKEVIAGLRAVDAEFDRTMSSVERKKAVAEIDARLAPLEDKVERAKRRLRELRGEKATARIDGNTEALDRKIINAERRLKRLDGKKATLEIKLKGHEKVLAAEAAMEAAEERRAKAAELSAKRVERAIKQERDAETQAYRMEDRMRRERMAAVEREARTRSALERQRVTEMRNAENEAHRMEAARQRFAYESTVGVEKEVARISGLKREYGALGDRLERLNKKGTRPFDREARIKAELDATGIVAKMAAIKAELQLIAREPPIEFEPKVKRSGVRKVTGVFEDMGKTILSKMSRVSDATVRVGPFTTSVKGLTAALAVLGPTLTDVGGALSALVGTLSAGVSGAAAIGAGALTGFAGLVGGLAFSTRNTRQEIQQARTSINAYAAAVLKYGRGSDKAKAKQDELNSVMRQISPLARESAKGIESFFDGWDRSTKRTQKSLGEIARTGFQALNQLRPMWANATNDAAGMIQRGLSRAFRYLGQGEGRGLLSGIFGDFNRQIPTMLSGLGKFGVTFLRIAREGARNLNVLTHGFDGLGDKLMAFTERSNFGDTIHSWVDQARDLMRFFGAAGRVVMHFFGDGSKAGQGFVRDMTAAMNRWDKFLTSARGKNTIADGMQRAVKGTEALWHAIAPIAGAFVQWASNLSPVVTGFLKAVGWASKLFGWLARISGMAGALSAIGVTLGTMWALGKAAAFVGLLERAVTLVKGIGEVGLIGTFKKLPTLFQGGSLAASGEVAAAEMRAGIISGATVGAAEFRAALATGGGIGAAENMAGGLLKRPSGLIVPAGVGAAEAEVGAAGAAMGEAEVAAGGLGAAIAGLGTAGTIAATGGLALLAGGLAYLIFKGDDAKDTTQQLREQSDRFAKTLPGLRGQLRELEGAYGEQAYSVQDAVTSYKDSRKALRQNREELGKAKKALQDAKKAGKDTTAQEQAYKDAVLNTKDALRAERDAYRSRYDERRREQNILKQAEAKAGEAAATAWLAAYDKRTGDAPEIDKMKARLAEARGIVNDPNIREDTPIYRKAAADVKMLTDKLSELRQEQADLDKQARDAKDVQSAVPIQLRREWNHLKPVVDKYAASLGRLARNAPNVANVLSNKFQNPVNAGKVAQSANQAVSAGVKQSLVYRILVDSKDAEEAIRRLNQVKLEQKILNVIQRGGHEAVALLERITGHKLTPKQLAIVEHGGKPALALLGRLTGARIGDKKFAAILHDLASVPLVQIRALLGNIQSKTVSVHVNYSHSGTLGGGGNRSAVPSLNASGTGGSSVPYNSIVGEGGGPEWLYSGRTGHAMKVSGPMLVRLQPDDAVIPTEPKYKGRGRDILRDIAGDMGLRMYKKGKKPATPNKHTPKVSGDKTVGVPGNKATLKKLKVPDPYKVGAVPVDLVDAAASKAISEYTQRENKIRSASDAKLRAEAVYKTYLGKGKDKQTYQSGKKKGQETEAWKAAKKRRNDTRDMYDTLVRGGVIAGKGTGTGRIPSEKQLKSDRDFAVQHRNAIHSFNDRISILETDIETERTKMATASAKYERTNGAQGADEYAAARDRRAADIKELTGKLNDSWDAIRKLKAKFPGMKGLKELEASTKGQLADAQSMSEEMQDKDLYPDALSAASPQSIDDWLKAQGVDTTLEGYIKDVAVAKVDNVEDDPGTPEREDIAKLSDDSAAAKKLMDFYKGQYDAAVSKGAADTVVGQLADAFTGARDDYNSLQDTINGPASERGPSQVDLMDTARADLYREYGSNSSPNVGGLTGPSGAAAVPSAPMADLATSSRSASRALAPSAASIPTSGPSAAQAAGGDKTVNVTNNYSVPPEDPHTWSAGVSFELGAMV